MPCDLEQDTPSGVHGGGMMLADRKSRCLLAVSVVLALGGCAQTKLNAVWKDPTYAGDRLRKILVIGVAENLDRRKTFENQFVAALELKGVDAVSSLRLIPGEEKLSKERIRSAIEGSGIDAVIVTRLVGVDVKYTQSPGGVYAVPYPYYNTLYGFYDQAYVYAAAPPQYDAKETVSLETNLYEAGEGKLIWTVLSSTTKKESVSEAINSLTTALIRRLAGDSLI
jgi:hypothetical protein